MKFFTIAVYESWYSTYEDDSQLKSAYQDYRRYLDGLRGILPEHIMALAELRGVDDGLVVEVRHDRRRHSLILTLRCGDLQMGYYDLVLRYEDADITPQDEQTLAQIARTTKSDRWHKSDAYYHELDRTDDGRIEHRWLFHYGLWFAIRCRALHWEKIDRPNQKLPRRKDRFPGGPSALL